MHFFIVAGEASGDLHASNLIKALKKESTEVSFQFIGGDRMAIESGVPPMVHYDKMNFMGLFDVLLNITRISRILKRTKNALQHNPPDAVILVDYAGFNLRVAKYAKSRRIKVFYYISPKVWAWRESRVKKLKAYVDKMFVILPFEPAYFRSHQMEVEYHGNPLADSLAEFHSRRKNRNDFIKERSLDKRPIVALLAGSRRQEIKHCLPLMIKASESFPEAQFIVAGAPSVDPELYAETITDDRIEVVYNRTYEILSHADAAVVTSGTATLETALFKVPQVVIYKTGGFTYRLGRLFVSFRFFSLVNLILDREVVKEFLQFNLESSIRDELKKLLNDARYQEIMQQGYDEIAKKIGKPGSSQRIADRILTLCS